MNILLICDARLPVFAYGGTERVVWDLANALSAMGHHVRLLAAAGTVCPFAEVLSIDPRRPLKCQIPDDVDIVHFHNRPEFDPDIDFFPYVYTQHGNEVSSRPMPLNTVFVSENHAHRFGSDQYVHNGLDWAPYGAPDFARSRKWVHFLGNAAWKVKNLRGAMQVARDAGEILAVLGGYRLNFKRGFRFTISPSVKFFGMVGGQKKLDLLNSSRGLIFPVIWDEPFGRLDTKLRQQLVSEQQWELKRRQQLYNDPPVDALHGRPLIVVDDGVATGLTVRAALQSLRAAQPTRLVLAVPVIDRQVAQALKPAVDDLVALATVDDLWAVGAWYQHFDVVQDQQVMSILAAAQLSPYR